MLAGRGRRILMIGGFLLAGVTVGVLWSVLFGEPVTDISLTGLTRMALDDEVERIVVRGNIVTAYTVDGEELHARKEPGTSIATLLQAEGVRVADIPISVRRTSDFGSAEGLLSLLTFLLVAGFAVYYSWAVKRCVVQVVTTLASRAQAEDLARGLADERAACVKVMGPFVSTYDWEGKREVAEEWACVATTTVGDFKAVEAAIRSRHPYAMPEILGFVAGVSGSDYSGWVRKTVREKATIAAKSTAG